MDERVKGPKVHYWLFMVIIGCSLRTNHLVIGDSNFRLHLWVIYLLLVDERDRSQKEHHWLPLAIFLFMGHNREFEVNGALERIGDEQFIIKPNMSQHGDFFHY